MLTATTKTATTVTNASDHFPIAKNDLVLWRATLANLKVRAALMSSSAPTKAKVCLNGDAGVTTVLEKACQWGRTGTVTPTT